MQSIDFSRYGGPDDLGFSEIDVPVPRDNEVLVRIFAASINSWDWELLHATPFANRMTFGLFRPKKLKTLGFDIAGRVEAVGSATEKFRVGDEVYGDLSASGWGGFAEFVSAPETALAAKPKNMSFEQAAAVPQAGLLAWQGLVDLGHIRPGQKILVNGASGGSGSFAIQIAKFFGAEITGVCSAGKMEFVRSLGADHVIDYTHEDFTRSALKYDLVIDAHALHSIFAYRHLLNPNGQYVAHGGATPTLISILLFGRVLSIFDTRRVRLLIHKANKGLEDLGQLIEAGKIVPVIDKVFPFARTIEALKYYGAGNARGKIVISMAEDNKE